VDSQEVVKIVATRFHILRLKCTKFDFGRGLVPDPAEGAYSAPKTPSWISRGLLLRKGRGRKGDKGKDREREREEREGVDPQFEKNDRRHQSHGMAG